MNMFDDRITKTRTKMKAMVVATDIKRGKTSSGDSFTYFNGKIKTGNTYEDRLTGEHRPSYFWVPVVAYKEVSDDLFDQLKVSDLVFITDGYIDAFRGDNGEQKGVRLIINSFQIKEDSDKEPSEIIIENPKAEVVNPFTGEPVETLKEGVNPFVIKDPSTVEEVLAQIVNLQKCLFFKRSANRMDMINERANSMSFTLRKRNGDNFYRVYPYNKTEKSDPSKKPHSHSFGKIRTVKDAQALLEIFIRCANLSNQ